MSHSQPNPDTEVEAYVLAALEQQALGEEPDYESICAQNPSLIPKVRRSVERASGLADMHAASVGGDSLAGQVIEDRYLLESRLGAGAMGVVYKALDQELGRPVAVKILRTPFMDQEQAEARFLREAESMASVSHPAVITVHDRGHTGDGDPFLVMELLGGSPLSDILDQATQQDMRQDGTAWLSKALGQDALDESSYLRTAVRWTADLAAGLETVHRADILHRDIKPSNIFIRRNGEPVLLDFGIATGESLATLTQAGNAMGTPAYMAPEALSPKEASNRAQDIYGLTASLYHMLTLAPPFQGSPSQVLFQLAQAEPPVASRLRPGLPRDLQAILDRGMERRPARRYDSAESLEADLRAFLEFRPVSARPISPPRRWLRKFRRSKAMLAASAVVLLVVLLWGGKSLWQDRQAARDARSDAALDRFPANMLIAKYPNRVCVDPEEAAHYTAIFDEAVRYAIRPLPAYLFRASFLLDQGDKTGALADIRVIDSRLDSPYTAALLQAYEALEPDAQGSKTLDLSELPEPQSSDEKFLAGFHLMRALDYVQASTHFRSPELLDYPPAAAYDLIALSAVEQWGKFSMEERRPLAQRMYELTLLLEEQLGRETATTTSLKVPALLHAFRPSDANRVADAGLRIAPYGIALLANKGKALEEIGDYESALEFLDRAIELRPEDDTPKSTRFFALAKLHRFERAAQVVDQTSYSDRKKHRYMGMLEGIRALIERETGELEVARQSALRALDHFSQAKGQSLYLQASCQAIVDGDESAVYRNILKQLESTPLDRWKLQRLATFAPADPTEKDFLAVNAYMAALSKHLAYASLPAPVATD